MKRSNIKKLVSVSTAAAVLMSSASLGFAASVSEIQDNHIRIGNDVYDLTSEGFTNENILASLDEGGNFAFVKLGGNWYDVMTLDSDQILDTEFATTEEDVAAWELDELYKADGTTEAIEEEAGALTFEVGAAIAQDATGYYLPVTFSAALDADADYSEILESVGEAGEHLTVDEDATLANIDIAELDATNPAVLNLRMSDASVAAIPDGAELGFAFNSGAITDAEGNVLADANLEATVTVANPFASGDVVISAAAAATDETSKLTTFTAVVANAEEGATATITITPDASLGADEIVVEDVAITDGAISYENATELPAGTHSFTVTVGEVVSDAAEFTIEDTVVEELTVESVSAINLKTITVTFSDVVTDETAAEKVANYTVKKGTATKTISDAVLSEDKKSVTIVMASAMTKDEEYSLTVENVAAYQGAFTPTDSQIPVIESVVALGQQSFEVTFSEPVSIPAVESNVYDFKLDDALLKDNAATQMTNAPTASRDLTKYTFVLDNPITAGTHTLELVRDASNHVADYAGYKVPVSSVDFNVEIDTTVPEIQTATALSQTEVQVTFNKPINLDNTSGGLNGNASTILGWRLNETSVKKVADSSAAITKVDNSTYKFSFTTNPLPAGETVQLVFTTNTSVKDFSDVQVASQTISNVEVPADALPDVASVTSETDDKFVVEFTNDMQNDTATNGVKRVANYTLTKDGEEVSLSGATFSYNSTDKELTVSQTGWNLEAGEYVLTIADVKDVVGNVMADKAVAFTVSDTTAPSAVTLSAAYEGGSASSDEDVMIISFNEDMAQTGEFSILDTDKFEVNDSNGTWTAINSDDVNAVEAIDAKTVRIKTKGDAFAFNTGSANNQVRAELVADETGNIIPSTLTSSAVQATAIASATYDLNGDATATVTANNKVELKVTRQIGTFVAGEFDVKVGGTSVDLSDVTYENTATGATITLTTAEDMDLTSVVTAGIKDVNTGTDANTKDINDFAFLDNKYSGTATVEIQPTLTKVVRTSATTLDLVFDQAIALTDENDFIVKLGDDTLATSGTSISSNVVTLTLSNALTSGSAQPTVETLANAEDLTTQTSAGAKLTPVTTAVTSVNFRATSIAINNEGDANQAGTDEIVITFNDAVDPATVITDNDFSAGAGSAWDGSDLTIPAADFTIVDHAGPSTSGNDEIVLAASAGTQFGIIDLGATDVVTADEAATDDVTIKLSADQKTITIVFGGAASDLGITATGTTNLANIAGPKYTPDAAIKSDAVDAADQNAINVSAEPQTATSF